ncbi:hypothetical protein BDN72DRAFT_901368 [Pluteus cervinus]|uniref:Uncharacterized protein n=1 Tax=Pluteus cervinus TaxID=181527 RepID=A0ACD3AGD1_9AGAR|nr:hypothetical protein BDN72DRAFT_901368 [Pluteus cervinus]
MGASEYAKELLDEIFSSVESYKVLVNLASAFVWSSDMAGRGAGKTDRVPGNPEFLDESETMDFRWLRPLTDFVLRHSRGVSWVFKLQSVSSMEDDCSAKKSVLRTPELISQIFDHLSLAICSLRDFMVLKLDKRSAPRSSLLAAATCCRNFNGPALDALWRTMDSFEPILNMLPVPNNGVGLVTANAGLYPWVVDENWTLCRQDPNFYLHTVATPKERDTRPPQYSQRPRCISRVLPAEFESTVRSRFLKACDGKLSQICLRITEGDDPKIKDIVDVLVTQFNQSLCHFGIGAFPESFNLNDNIPELFGPLFKLPLIAFHLAKCRGTFTTPLLDIASKLPSVQYLFLPPSAPGHATTFSQLRTLTETHPNLTHLGISLDVRYLMPTIPHTQHELDTLQVYDSPIIFAPISAQTMALQLDRLFPYLRVLESEGVYSPRWKQIFDFIQIFHLARRGA